jgi:hypothetical protein
MDDAAALKFGDFGELHPDQLPRRSFGQAEMVSDPATEGDAEPPPQLGRPPLPHQMAGVVIAVHTKRLPTFGVGVIMDRHTPTRPTMRTQLTPVTGPRQTTAATGPARLLRGMHEAE